MQLSLPTRPKPSQVSRSGGPQLKGRPVSLLTNYYKFEFLNNDRKRVYKYHVKFTPELSEQSKKVRCKLINGLRDELEKLVGFYIFLGGNIYTMGMARDLPQFSGSYDDQDYKIDIQWVQEIGQNDRDMLVFMKVFFNSMLKKIKFKQIGRNHFNP